MHRTSALSRPTRWMINHVTRHNSNLPLPRLKPRIVGVGVHTFPPETCGAGALHMMMLRAFSYRTSQTVQCSAGLDVVASAIVVAR